MILHYVVILRIRVLVYVRSTISKSLWDALRRYWLTHIWCIIPDAFFFISNGSFPIILLFIIGLAKFLQVWILVCLNSRSTICNTILFCSLPSEVDSTYLSSCKPTRLLLFRHTRTTFVFNRLLLLFRGNFLLQCFQVLLSELLINEGIRFVAISRDYSSHIVWYGNNLSRPWAWVIPDIIIAGDDFLFPNDRIPWILPNPIASLLLTTSFVCRLGYRI